MDRSMRVFGELTTFDKAFPALEDAILEYRETGYGTYEQYQSEEEKKRKYDRQVSIKERGGLLRCSNPSCRRGGYEIDFAISAMTGSKQTEKEGFIVCHGDEGTPKGRKIGRRCVNTIHYKLTLTYKESKNEQTPAPKSV
ncbi:MAG: hypothetical protein WC861_00185 [Candidatus Micrarchaeia archaeon]